MSIEKTFTEFMSLHEKKNITKEVIAVEKDISALTDRVSSIIESEEDMTNIIEKISEGMKDLKKILNKHSLYEL